MNVTDKLAEALRKLIPYAESDGAPNDFLDSADTALAEYDANPGGWRPIETAPKDEWILVGPTKRMERCVAMNCSRDGWITETRGEPDSIYTPAHWQPLPPPPKEPQA